MWGGGRAGVEGVCACGVVGAAGCHSLEVPFDEGLHRRSGDLSVFQCQRWRTRAYGAQSCRTSAHRVWCWPDYPQISGTAHRRVSLGDIPPSVTSRFSTPPDRPRKPSHCALHPGWGTGGGGATVAALHVYRRQNNENGKNSRIPYLIDIL